MCVERRRFERVYALPEQIADPAFQTTTSPEEGLRTLVSIAAAALGIATEADLADYWRTRRADIRPAIAELEASGELQPVEVPGWTVGSRPAPAWLHRDARRPRRVDRVALLSPFDPLVWFRPRTEIFFYFK